GDTLELTCSTIGCESPSFSWRSQLDKPLDGSVNSKESRSILTMDPVGFGNDNEYLCSAFCDHVKKEKSIKVDVYSFPSDPVIEISTPLNVGEKANITCMVPKVYPFERLKMQLEKDGSVLGMKEFYHEEHTKTTETKCLTLTFIPTFEDIGKAITCVAELLIDEMEFEPKKRQTSQRLSVNYGPRNTTVSVTPSTTVKEGGAVTMTCTSYGNPAPKMFWTKHLISGVSQFLSENATLTINSVKAEDLGLYECEGVNQFGREKKTVDLIVQGALKSVRILPSTSVMSRMFHRVHLHSHWQAAETLGRESGFRAWAPAQAARVTQQCLRGSTTPMSPRLSAQAKRLTAMGCLDMLIVCESGRCTIYGAQLQDAGMCECESSNEFGQQFKNIMLDVKGQDYVIPLIVVLSCLSPMAIPVLAILVYMSRKAKINGSYSPVNAPKPNV
uniref:Ig-like domain-containing protein n=1 Tax=Gopherus evgoodei TaxID=1825980 RepID=A0A8C4WGZ0_9SAUR